MADALSELTGLVPPPIAPVAAHGEWQQIEAAMGLTFPSDYKRFIARYGNGVLCSLFEIISPFYLIDPPREFWINWTEFFKAMAEYGEEIPYPLYPQIPGLLPCGSFGTSNVICWYTDSSPDQWTLKYYDRDRGFFSVDCGLVAFLLAALSGNSSLPHDVLNSEHIPRPYVFQPSKSAQS